MTVHLWENETLQQYNFSPSPSDVGHHPGAPGPQHLRLMAGGVGVLLRRRLTVVLLLLLRAGKRRLLLLRVGRRQVPDPHAVSLPVDVQPGAVLHRRPLAVTARMRPLATTAVTSSAAAAVVASALEPRREVALLLALALDYGRRMGKGEKR